MWNRHRRTGQAVTLAIALSMTGLLGACSGGDSTGGDSTGNAPTVGGSPPSTRTATTTSPPAPATGGDNLTSASGPRTKSSTTSVARLLRAGANAERAVPHGTLVAIEYEASRSLWEAKVVTRDGTTHVMSLSGPRQDAVNGLRIDAASAHEKARHRRRVDLAKLDFRQAAKKVTSVVPGGLITELELDTYRDTTVWEADVLKTGTKRQVTLDARDGRTLANETHHP